MHQSPERFRNPMHIILVFYPRRAEGIQIGELSQAVITPKIIEEGKVAPRIPLCSEVFDESNLHLCTR